MPRADRSDDYLDFKVALSAEKGLDGLNYFAQVDSSNGVLPRVPLALFDKAEDLEKLRLRLELALARGSSNVRGPVSKEEKDLRDFGQRVFDGVFSQKEVATLYTLNKGAMNSKQDRVTGIRIRLRIDTPDLACLPWEYLFSDDDFLGLDYESPIIRWFDAPYPEEALEVDGPLNILGMIANPGRGNPHSEWSDLKEEEERDRIEKALAPHRQAGRVYFRWVPGGTPEQLLTWIEKAPWHVFHFIGHGGTYEPQTDSPPASSKPEGFIVFSDGRGGATEMSGVDLKHLLDRRSLRVVVLNCCESARGASPAATLIRYKRIAAVVAMQYPITDDAAITFSGAFYESLANNKPVEYAITHARKAMQLKSRTEWGIPVLFSRSTTGRLFNRDTSRTPTPLPSGASAGPPGPGMEAHADWTPAAAPPSGAPVSPSSSPRPLMDARARLQKLFDERPSSPPGPVW